MGAVSDVVGEAVTETSLRPPDTAARERVHRILMVGEGVPFATDRRSWLQAIALRNAGYAVTVISPAGPSGTPTGAAIEGIRFLTYQQPITSNNVVANQHAARSESFLLARLVFREAMAAPGYSLLTLARPGNVTLPAAWISRFLRKPLIVDYRLPGPEAYLESGGVKESPAYRKELRRERQLLSSADLIQCPNAPLKQLIASRLEGRAEDICVLRGSVDTMLTVDQKPSVSPFNRRRYLAAYAGPLTLYSGADLFIRAARRIVYGLDRTDIQFVVVGSGPHDQAIRDLVQAEGLKDYVTCLHGDETGLMASLLSSADVAVDPTPNSGLGALLSNPMLFDYWRLGVPAVAFDRAEVPAELRDGIHLVRDCDIPGLADGILRRLETVDVNSRATRTVRQVPAELSWQKSGAPAYVASLETVLKRRLPAAQSRSAKLSEPARQPRP